MTPLERVERAKGSPFIYRINGKVEGLPSPADMTFDQIVAALVRKHHALLPARMPEWKAIWLADAWAAHFDLPTLRQLQRLKYLIERYHDALESDLRVHAAGADLGELWRQRRWRYLLNLIDHLPGHSWYSAAVARDPEHADMLAKAEQERQDSGQAPAGPSLSTWTPEVAVLADLIDAVNHVSYSVQMSVWDGKGAKPESLKPYARPVSAVVEARKRAEYQRRLKKHAGLVAKLLPGRAENPD